MEAYIIDKGYEVALYPAAPFNEEVGTKAEYDKYLKDREAKSIKAAALIKLALEDGPLIQVKGLKEAIQIWDRLKELYEPKGFSSEFLICKELFSTTLSRCGGSIEAYLTKIKRLSDELAVRKLSIPNKVIIAYALNNLTSEYEHTVAILTQNLRSSTEQVELSAIFSYLIDEARRLKSLQPQEMAMSASIQNNAHNKLKCGFCKKKGHSIDKYWKKHPNLKPKKAQDGSQAPKSTETTLISQDKEEGQLAEDQEYALSTISPISDENV